MSKADELLRRSIRITDEVGDAMQLVIVLPNGDSAWMGCYEPDSIAANVLLSLRAYLNEKPHEPMPDPHPDDHGRWNQRAPAPPPHAAAERTLTEAELDIVDQNLLNRMGRKAAAEPEKPVACKHETLLFGSGGFYVFCKTCTRRWVAIKGPKDTDLDYAAGADQLSGQERTAETPLYAAVQQPIAREPTKEMTKAGTNARLTARDDASTPDVVDRIWTAMYDAALKSAEGEK